MKEQHSSHFRKIGACLHQLLNLRKENLLWTPARQCIWSAERTWSDFEMETLTKSYSRTTVITANGEVQTHEEAAVYVKELEKFLTMKVLENTPAALTLGKLREENGYSYECINGQKPHLIKNGIRIQCDTENFVPFMVPGLSTSSSSSSYHSTSKTPTRQERPCTTFSSSSSSLPTTSSTVDETREKEDRTEGDTSPVPVSISNVDDRTGQPVVDQANQKFPKTKVKQDRTVRPVVCWLKSRKFRNPVVAARIQGNFLDDEVLERRDSHASSSHEVSLEPTFKRREDLGKHSVYTHFPEDRNGEICQRTEITRVPCRRRNGGAVLRAEFWWLDNSRSQGSQWKLWISKETPLCCL